MNPQGAPRDMTLDSARQPEIVFKPCIDYGARAAPRAPRAAHRPITGMSRIMNPAGRRLRIAVSITAR
jgi:hypothetical protein